MGFEFFLGGRGFYFPGGGELGVKKNMVSKECKVFYKFIISLDPSLISRILNFFYVTSFRVGLLSFLFRLVGRVVF